MTSHTPKLLTEADAAADLAGVPRPVSAMEALTMAAELAADGLPDEGAMIRTLVSERDALAGRVAELEAERDDALADSERRHTLLKMQHAESVELYNALSDLSFECDGVTCVLPPSRETYNRTFMVLKMKPHLSPAALRGHGESGGTAIAPKAPPAVEPKRDLMFATVAMQQREEERIKRIVSGLEQVKQEHIASKGAALSATTPESKP